MTDRRREHSKPIVHGRRRDDRVIELPADVQQLLEALMPEGSW